MVTKVCYKITETLNNISDEHKDEAEGDSDGVITVQILSEYGEDSELSLNMVNECWG